MCKKPPPPINITNVALHDTLQGNGMIEAYEVYKKKDSQEVICFVRFGNRLNGHPGVVHGGILSLAVDNSFGWLFISQKFGPAFTANLNINFRYSNIPTRLRHRSFVYLTAAELN